MANIWWAAEARHRFSEIADAAVRGQAQFVKRRDGKEVVVVSRDYLEKTRPTLKTHLLQQFSFWPILALSTSCSGSTRASVGARRKEIVRIPTTRELRQMLGSSPSMTKASMTMTKVCVSRPKRELLYLLTEGFAEDGDDAFDKAMRDIRREGSPFMVDDRGDPKGDLTE